MQKMKESFVVKVIAYILILLCMMVTVFSGILIYINASNQWYTMGKDACCLLYTSVTDIITEGRKKTPIGESMRELILQEDEG